MRISIGIEIFREKVVVVVTAVCITVPKVCVDFDSTHMLKVCEHDISVISQ